MLFILLFEGLIFVNLTNTPKQYPFLNYEEQDKNSYLSNNNILLTSLIELQLMEHGPMEELFYALDSFNN